MHETYFFRDWPQLKQLQQRMLPERIRAAEAGSRGLRLLSAGCATGEEAYSLATLALEALEQRSQAVRMRDNILVPAPDRSLHILGLMRARHLSRRNAAFITMAQVYRLSGNFPPPMIAGSIQFRARPKPGNVRSRARSAISSRFVGATSSSACRPARPSSTLRHAAMC